MKDNHGLLINKQSLNLSLPQVGDPLSHACNAGNDVAMGDHDSLRKAGGTTGVHDDCDV